MAGDVQEQTYHDHAHQQRAAAVAHKRERHPRERNQLQRAEDYHQRLQPEQRANPRRQQLLKCASTAQRDVKGALLRTLADVLIAPEGNQRLYPRIVALDVKRNGGASTLLPWGGTEDLAGNKIILQRPAAMLWTNK